MRRDRFARGGIVDGGDRRHRLAAIAHLVARQRMLAARDRQHAEGLVAVGAGDDRLHAGELAAPPTRRPRRSRRANRGCDRCGPASWPGAENVGGVFGAAGHLLRPVDHRHVAADIVRGDDFVHGATPLRVERGGVFHRLDDFHVAGAAADVAAERFQDFRLARIADCSAASRPRP